MKITNLALSLALILSIGCVSKRSYDTLFSETVSLREETLAQSEKIKTQGSRIADQATLISSLQGKMGVVKTHSAELDRSLAETRQALNEMATRKGEMEKELREFKTLTFGLQSMIDTGNVRVSFVKGRMVVTLGSDVLFGSGSAKLSSDGTAAVEAVTQQLARISGKDFQVEGHTDNVPIKTKTYRSNWHLASARALTVINAMISSGMPPDRVSAASYAEMRPTASNDFPEGRAANRRIDIVVVPDLTKLMDVDALARQSGGATPNVSASTKTERARTPAFTETVSTPEKAGETEEDSPSEE